MTYVTVITTDNAFNVDFGIYSGASLSAGTIPSKRSFRKDNIVFSLYADRVEAQTINNALTFPITFDGAAGTFKISSVNGVSPTSNSDLFDKLTALLG